MKESRDRLMWENFKLRKRLLRATVERDTYRESYQALLGAEWDRLGIQGDMEEFTKKMAPILDRLILKDLGFSSWEEFREALRIAQEDLP